MLTERTLRDYAWCPKLLREPEHRDKRFKVDRDDWITPLLVAAIKEKRSNKYVTIEKDFLGGYVLYNTDGAAGFWVIVTTDEGQILLRIDQVLIDDEENITFYRNQKYDYQSEDEKAFEDACRTLLHQHLLQYFEPHEFVVISHFLDDTEHSTDKMVSGDTLQAESLLRKVFEIEQELSEGSAQTQKCPRCWWKECPYRKTPKLITRPGRRGMAK